MDCRLRNETLAARLRVLPGSLPYTNRRRLSVAGRFDGMTLRAFLAARHAHIAASTWETSLAEGRLEVDGKVVSALDRVVRAGNQIVHVLENEVEPPVSAALRFLHEDDDIIVLAKPAPLPVHPSGRFNKNTVVGLLAAAFDDLSVHPVHRLDADTTGVLLLAKNPAAARALGRQLEARTVGKRYLAHVHGSPPARFDVDAPVRTRPDASGKRDSLGGAPALTRFWTLARAEQSAVVAAWPRSGRTNQIRVHLAHVGHPIVGDVAYGPDANTEFQSGGALRLHADALRFRHPSNEAAMRFVAPRPAWASELVV